jgi:hypothetical protein
MIGEEWEATMKNNLYLLAFLLGLAAALSGAAALKWLGLSLQPGTVTQAQAAGLPEVAPSAPASSAPAAAPGYSLDWSTLDGGGGLISGGSYRLVSTIGQPDAVASAGSGFTLQGGFLPGTLQPWQFFLPAVKK